VDVNDAVSPAGPKLTNQNVATVYIAIVACETDVVGMDCPWLALQLGSRCGGEFRAVDCRWQDRQPLASLLTSKDCPPIVAGELRGRQGDHHRPDSHFVWLRSLGSALTSSLMTAKWSADRESVYPGFLSRCFVAKISPEHFRSTITLSSRAV
jgi:hypothetical protein